MPDQTPDQSLHLPSLVIKNFRGIDELTIPRLGRVTLLTGKNGVGKTTVLDAVRVWTSRADPYIIDSILADRGDVNVEESDKESPNNVPDRVALFTDRRDVCEVIISPLEHENDDALRIKRTPEHETDAILPELQALAYALEPVELQRKFGGSGFQSMRRSSATADYVKRIPCSTFGPDGPSDEMIERHWSDLALTAHEDRALDALNLLTDGTIERVAQVPTTDRLGRLRRRRFMARVSGKEFRMTLRSLGGGALRAFAVALALVKSSDGFLLIDEAENGIHHSVQAKFWNMVLQTAQRNNVQVIATTHSWDCVEGFAQAANELEDIEGLLVRIERVPVGLRAITYDESRLASVTKYDIEVR